MVALLGELDGLDWDGVWLEGAGTDGEQVDGWLRVVVGDGVLFRLPTDIEAGARNVGLK